MEKGVEGRFITDAAPFANQQLIDFIHEKYPEIAKDLKIKEGVPGKYFYNEEGMCRTDNSKSIKEVSHRTVKVESQRQRWIQW